MKMLDEEVWREGTGSFYYGWLGTWEFENGIRVVEKQLGGDLHCFECYDEGGLYLGMVTPSAEDLAGRRADLDAGRDPVSAGWEDGMSHACTMDGWAYNADMDDFGKGEGYDDEVFHVSGDLGVGENFFFGGPARRAGDC